MQDIVGDIAVGFMLLLAILFLVALISNIRENWRPSERRGFPIEPR